MPDQNIQASMDATDDAATFSDHDADDGLTPAQRETIQREYGADTIEVLDAGAGMATVYAVLPSENNTGLTIGADGAVIDRWEIHE